jgi:hypothetical protein
MCREDCGERWSHINSEFKEEWDKADVIVNTLKRKLQYPEGGPDNEIHRAETETEVKVFNGWVDALYNLSCDLQERTEKLLALGDKCEKAFNDSQISHDPKDFVQAPKTL